MTYHLKHTTSQYPLHIRIVTPSHTRAQLYADWCVSLLKDNDNTGSRYCDCAELTLTSDLRTGTMLADIVLAIS